MNRGTALRWADKLEALDEASLEAHRGNQGPARMAPYAMGQIGYLVDGERHLSPTGVLADFLDADGWSVAWDGVSLLWHGEQFTLPAFARKKAKMKTDGYAPIVLGDTQSNCAAALDGKPLVQIEEEFSSHTAFASFVRDHYAAI